MGIVKVIWGIGIVLGIREIVWDVSRVCDHVDSG